MTDEGADRIERNLGRKDLIAPAGGDRSWDVAGIHTWDASNIGIPPRFSLFSPSPRLGGWQTWDHNLERKHGSANPKVSFPFRLCSVFRFDGAYLVVINVWIMEVAIRDRFAKVICLPLFLSFPSTLVVACLLKHKLKPNIMSTNSKAFQILIIIIIIFLSRGN